MTTSNPFLIDTHLPLVAIQGQRAGYIQLASSKPSETYADLPETALIAAKDWAQKLETEFNSPRTYWITLSEAVRQLHIHLYPRWPEDTDKSLDLFNQRDTESQPKWTPDLIEALQSWAERHQVCLL